MNVVNVKKLLIRTIFPTVMASTFVACGGSSSTGGGAASLVSAEQETSVSALTPASSSATSSAATASTIPEASDKLQEFIGRSQHGATPASSTTTTSTTTTEASKCYQASSTVTPVISTQAQWDAKWTAKYGTTVPNLSGDGQTFAWQGFYDVRAYVSMAKTFGDTKYLDRSVSTINYWFAHTDGGPKGQGWAYTYGQAQSMLDTGVIAQAIATFSYEVWNDSRFTAYRPQATAYLKKLEPMLHAYDAQWVTNAPYTGAPSDWVYSTCGSGSGLCSSASLVMFNQSATLAKTLLLISRTYTLAGLVPDPTYLVKANAVAAYFKTFVQNNGSAYSWSYGGARIAGNGPEDISHGDLDLSLVNWAEHYGMGGLTSSDMTMLVGTEKEIFNAGSATNPAFYVDGTGTPTSYYTPAVGWNWIDLTDFDSTSALFNKTVTLFNAYPMTSNPDGYFLGWAEILRKKSCVSLY